MDFYNLQEKDHELLEGSMKPVNTSSVYREYLRKQFFDFDKLAGKSCILVAEEDPRVQRAMYNMIREENPHATCLFADSIEEIEDVLEEVDCDLLVANYYIAEDEIDYEQWDQFRLRYPETQVIIMSHINDREYYEMLEELEKQRRTEHSTGFGVRIKTFFENVFGGTHGHH